MLPKAASSNVGAAKCPPAVASDSYTPAAPKPMISALPSRVTSASSRGVGVVAAPTAGHGAEGGKLERGGGKVPACGGQGLVDAGRAEGDDVGSGVPVHVCQDRKSTRLNSSHLGISYAVFCLKK